LDDGPGSRTVRARIADKDGGFTDYTTVIAVDNVAPEFELGPDETLVPAQLGQFDRTAIAIIDPGVDIFSGIVNYGDGAGMQPLTINQAAGTFDLSHTYGNSGTFTIEVSVEDGDGGSHTDSFDVTVIRSEVQFTSPDFSAAEADAGTIELARNNASVISQVQIDITGGSAIAGVDYDNTNFPLLVTLAVDELTKSIFLPVIDEHLVELNETITFEVTAVENVLIGSQNTTTLTVLNDDTAVIDLFGITSDEAIGGLDYTVAISNPVDVDVSVEFDTLATGTATPSADFVAVTDQVVIFAAGSTAPQTITVTVTDENMVEPDETVVAEINTLNADGRNVTIAPTATATIVNDDTAVLTVANLSQAETDSTTTFTFSVALNNEVQDGLTVAVDTSDGTAQDETGGNDYVANKGSPLSFAGAANEIQTFSVTVNGDDTQEADEFFDILLGALSDIHPTGADDISTVDGRGTIENDDYSPAANAGGPYVIGEGEALKLDSSLTGDADTLKASLNYRWDVDGDGDFDENITGVAPSLTWLALADLGIDDGPDGPRNVTVEVSDGSNIAANTTTLTVNNKAPALTANDAAVTADEGQTAANTGTFSDPGLTEDVTIAASIGSIIQDSGNKGSWNWSFAATDGPDQSRIVTVKATDNDGGESTTSFTLAVNNVSPQVEANNSTVLVDESQTVTNTGVYSDVGLDDVTIAASIGMITQDDIAGTWSWSLDTTDGPQASRVVTISATDSDGAEGTTTFDLLVINVAPTAEVAGPYVAAVGEDIYLDGSESFDPDAAGDDGIQTFDWEIEVDQPPDNDFDDGHRGDRVAILGGFASVGAKEIGLRVTDHGGLTAEDVAMVTIHERLVTDLAVRPKGTKIQLTWTKAGAEAAIFRSEAGPNHGFEEIARTQSDHSTYLDRPIELDKDYYYRVYVYAQVGDAEPLGISAAEVTRSLGRVRDTTAPTIAAGLANDTGTNGDGITADPTIAGTITDIDVLSEFWAWMDGGAPVDVRRTAALAGGGFHPDRSQPGGHQRRSAGGGGAHGELASGGPGWKRLSGV